MLNIIYNHQGMTICDRKKLFETKSIRSMLQIKVFVCFPQVYNICCDSLELLIAQLV